LLGFGDQLVNTSTLAQTVTVTNVGSAPLMIGSITVTGPNPGSFNLAGGTCATGHSLAVDANCTINVLFKPLASGPRKATLNINLPNQPASLGAAKVALSGTGTKPIASLGPLTPAPLISTRGCSTTCASGTMTLKNTGTAPLTITGITVEGINPGLFTPATSNCGNSLAAGSSCAITVSFHPASAVTAGAKSATLTVHDNSHGSATTQSTALAGTAK